MKTSKKQNERGEKKDRGEKKQRHKAQIAIGHEYKQTIVKYRTPGHFGSHVLDGTGGV